nr:centrosomal protein of 295 kDa-like [Penaeus vannamei]
MRDDVTCKQTVSNDENMTSNSLRRNLRLSPNELDNLLREEKKKWQIFRLQQVREQAKVEAQRVRKAVVCEKIQIEDGLKQELLAKYLNNKNVTEKKLQEEYLMCLQAFGEAHRGAKNEPDPSKVLADRAQYNNIKANRRGREAAKAEAEQQAHRNHEKNRPIRQRQDALQLEKARAQRVAKLPIPEAFRKKKPIIQEKVSEVQLYEAGTYTTTKYVPKNTVVEKEIKSTHPNAHDMARKEAEEVAAKAEAELQEAEEEAQKREQRGKEALARERLNRRYIELMEKLQQAQQDHQLSSYMRGADLTVCCSEVDVDRLFTVIVSG